jgi:hypothetical protein
MSETVFAVLEVNVRNIPERMPINDNYMRLNQVN